MSLVCLRAGMSTFTKIYCENGFPSEEQLKEFMTTYSQEDESCKKYFGLSKEQNQLNLIPDYKIPEAFSKSIHANIFAIVDSENDLSPKNEHLSLLACDTSAEKYSETSHSLLEEHYGKLVSIFHWPRDMYSDIFNDDDDDGDVLQNLKEQDPCYGTCNLCNSKLTTDSFTCIDVIECYKKCDYDLCCGCYKKYQDDQLSQINALNDILGIPDISNITISYCTTVAHQKFVQYGDRKSLDKLNVDSHIFDWVCFQAIYAEEESCYYFINLNARSPKFGYVMMTGHQFRDTPVILGHITKRTIERPYY